MIARRLRFVGCAHSRSLLLSVLRVCRVARTLPLAPPSANVRTCRVLALVLACLIAVPLPVHAADLCVPLRIVAQHSLAPRASAFALRHPCARGAIAVVVR